MSDHICGSCSHSFGTLEDYSAHVCKTTGERADSVEHHDKLTDGNYSKVSAAALARGEKRK